MSHIDQRKQLAAQIDDRARQINTLLDGDLAQRRKRMCDLASLCDRARCLYRAGSPTRAALLLAARALWWIATHDMPANRHRAVDQ